MAKWKLCRQTYGNDIYEFSEGDEVTIGRGTQNTIILPSLNISRKHCVIVAKKDEVVIEDLKSANGIFVGLKKIAPNVPFSLSNNDVIGLGWTDGAPLARVNDAEKFVFKLLKTTNDSSIIDRIVFQNENEAPDIPAAILNNSLKSSPPQLTENSSKLSLKRKPSLQTTSSEETSTSNSTNVNIQNSNKLDNNVKKFKSSFEFEDVKVEPGIKMENEDVQYEAFNIKQECFDDEVQVIDSDSDSEQWFIRLSQNSPRKSFTTFNENRKSSDCQQDCSYSQLDDNVIFVDTNEKCNNESDEEQYEDDLFTLLPPPVCKDTLDGKMNNKVVETFSEINKKTENNLTSESITTCNVFANKDPKPNTCVTDIKGSDHSAKRIQLIDYKSQACMTMSVQGSKSKKKKKKDHNPLPSSKIQMNISQKEERKKKLREIATKGKADGGLLCSSTLLRNEESAATSKVNAKVTISNRGAFLIDSEPATSIPSKRRKSLKDNRNDSKKVNVKVCSKGNVKEHILEEKPNKTKDLRNKAEKIDLGQKPVPNKDATSLPSSNVTDSSTTVIHRGVSVNTTKEAEYKRHSPPHNEALEISHSLLKATEKNESSSAKASRNMNHNKDNLISQAKENLDDKTLHNQQLLKVNPGLKMCYKTILKPLKENKEPEKKVKKKVRFSDVDPEIRIFEIEQGNQMKKTSNVKTALLATRHDMPVFSLQKIALMRILRWNPQWLVEQNNFTEPPPILGHNNVPLSILHSFTSHTQYVELIGDLLLMEIWECLTQGFVKTHSQNNYHQLRVESLPLVPTQRRGLDLINLNVNVSLPTVQANLIPREGEILMVHFGDDTKICRFFFVHNVRCLPSPPNNINSFYSITLQTSFTEKIKTLQRGAIMYGKSLAYINKDLRLFEAMEYLSRSPLSDAILNPQPKHFVMGPADCIFNVESEWTKPLNDSQRRAVICAVSAAMGDRPRIQMVQGPPGTGKSRVICAMVMAYFYDAAGKKQKNPGKILICATSNAAVDELVLRLLDIRQSLPKAERLNMVRSGRVEAMHPRARDISSLKLAQRDAARLQPDPAPGLSAEISLLEAKKNMWLTKANSTDDDGRVAYCLDRVAEITKKIAMFRGGGSGAACAPEQLAHAERRVLECADVVLTTLASAHSHKMRGLAGRIALCIVDEAGQAVEPESLVPLTLGVTRLALVGDPQQLPGFICSQRAKNHGLDKSLFFRLSSCAEAWGEGGPILLDRQYRMHPHIADYPNRAFYGGLVRSDPPRPLALYTAPYFVLGIDSGDNGQDASGANDAEAWGAARVALALRARLRGALPPGAPAAPAHALAVITPYAAQRDLVRHHLRALLQTEGDEVEVEVNTVDSFQGQERGVVVVSLARSHGLGFAAHAGRMNVMLTRAMHALVLCLNPRALENNNQWRSLVEDAQKRNMYGTLPIQLCRNPSVQRISSEEILQYLTYKAPVGNTLESSGHRPSKKHKRRRRPASRDRRNNT